MNRFHCSLLIPYFPNGEDSLADNLIDSSSNWINMLPSTRDVFSLSQANGQFGVVGRLKTGQYLAGGLVWQKWLSGTWIGNTLQCNQLDMITYPYPRYNTVLVHRSWNIHGIKFQVINEYLSTQVTVPIMYANQHALHMLMFCISYLSAVASFTNMV